MLKLPCKWKVVITEPYLHYGFRIHVHVQLYIMICWLIHYFQLIYLSICLVVRSHCLYVYRSVR